MITILDKRLPKIYERVVLEEYYRFFTRLECGEYSRIHHRPFKFTTDSKKAGLDELRNERFRLSVETYETIDQDDIEFMCLGKERQSDEEELLMVDSIDTVARIKVDSECVHIAEIIFLDYPTNEEIAGRINEVLHGAEYYASNKQLPKVYYEVPKCDDWYLSIAYNNGYTQIEEDDRSKQLARTFLLEKELERKKDENEWSRSRKQGKKSNK